MIHTNSSRKIVRIVAGLLVGIYVLAISSPSFVNASDATWTQNNWVGGDGQTSWSDVTRFSSQSNINFGVANQLTLSGASSWFNTSWAYRKKITFNNANQAQNLTDFPVMVRLTSSNFDFSKAQSAGQDIRFTDSNGTTSLSYEIESYSSGSQDATLWVKVPQIDASSSTDNIYIYYGNSGATDGQAATSVWTNQASVWHLKESGNGTAGEYKDSTSNALNAQGGGGTASAVPTLTTSGGQVNGAQVFDGTDDYINLGTNTGLNMSASTAFTISGWVKTSETYGFVASFRNSGDAGNAIIDFAVGFDGVTNSAGKLLALVRDNSGGAFAEIASISTINNGAWHSFALTRTNGSTIQLYIDGVSQGTASGAGTGGAISTNLRALGRETLWTIDNVGTANERFLNATIDEVKISTTTQRSSQWIAAEHRSGANTFNTFASEESPFATSGSLTSSIFDTGSANNYWGVADQTINVPANTTATVKVRTSNSATMVGAPAFSTCTAVTNGQPIAGNNCVVRANRYIQYEVSFTSNGANTPTLQSLSFTYNSDSTAPPTNASAIVMKTAAAGRTLASNDWNNAPTPYFSWTAGADDVGGSGLRGYCLYLGTGSSADPATTSGLLTNSPASITDTNCGFIVSGLNIDLSTGSFLSSGLVDGTTYYFHIKAIDNAANTAATAASFQFRQDVTAPTNVTSISTPGTSFANVEDMFFSWPVTGGTAASDTHSGVLGYQYQINSTAGTWLGTTTDACGISYIPAATNTYDLTNAQDGSSIVVGDNTVYFRTVDNACTPSGSSTYRTGLLSYGGAAPTFGGGDAVTVTPTASTTNSFAFSWPAATASSGNTITHYYYMVNTSPPALYSTITSNPATYIDNGTSRTVPADVVAAAVKGSNTVYVVAVDNLNNYSPSNAISGTFILNSTLPDPPKNLSVSDASIKSASLWRAALAWETPDYVGLGNLTYKIQRSTDGSSWVDVGTTSSTSYVDTVAEPIAYYWRVGSYDSSAESTALPSYANAVTLTPKGRFTSPPNLVSGPTYVVNPTSLNVKWVTDREASSFVQIKDGNSFVSEQGETSQVTSHEVTVVGLLSQRSYSFSFRSTDVDGNVLIGNDISFTTASLPSIYDVNASNVTLKSAIINFKSTSVANFTLHYGTTSDYGSTVAEASGAGTTNHSISLTNLNPGTLYYYRVLGTDSIGNELKTDNSFSTLPEPKIEGFSVTQVPDQPSTTLRLSWKTNVPTSTTAKYSLDNKSFTEKSTAELIVDHQVVINELLDNSTYYMFAQGVDQFGNSTRSATQTFQTPQDTRAPKISDIRIEASNDSNQSAQVIVGWTTDEPATSQVEYGEGSSSTVYTNLSPLNSALTLKHLVVLSNLSPGKPYHLRVVSLDEGQNRSESADYISVTGQVSRSALQIILQALQSVFGWIRVL